MGGRVGPVVVECPHTMDPPRAAGVCAVTGATAQLITGGSVLLPGKILHGGQVLVDHTAFKSPPGAGAAN